MAFDESTKGHHDCSRLSTLTTELFDLCARGLSFIGEPKVIFDRVDTLYPPWTDDERWLDSENRIALQKFIPVQEEMRDKRAISRCTDHEVNMCRPERMAPHCRE